MALFIRLISTASVCVLLIAICGIVFGFLAGEGFTLTHAYNANFLIGAIVVASGIVVLFLPGKQSFKRSKLVDHSTYIERTRDERDVKQKKGYDLLFLGILIIIIAGIIQVVHWLIMR